MPLSIQPSSVIKQFLIDEAVGVEVDNTDTDWQIWRNDLPDTDNPNIIGVYDTSPRLDGSLMSTGEVIEHGGIQIRVRGKPADDAEARIIAIREKLDSVAIDRSVTVSPYAFTIQRCRRTTGIIPIDRDERRFRTYIMNMTCTIREGA